MPDYKKMYFTLFHATENAINELIAAQRQCEELYLAADKELNVAEPPLAKQAETKIDKEK